MTDLTDLSDLTDSSHSPSQPMPLLLASKSQARARMLTDIGLVFDQYDPAIDEQEVKRGLQGQGATGAQVAETLAELKAQKASMLHPGQLIIASDQVLECGGTLFDKPVDMDHAHAQLMALAGKDHQLLTSVCLVMNGQRLWHFNDFARIGLRPLSQAQITTYLVHCGPEIVQCVGCYRVEKEGALIFSRVSGDPYTIQGLPVIALRNQLEALGYPVLGQP